MGLYVVGAGDGTITEHMLEHAEYYRQEEEHQRDLADKGSDIQGSENARLDYIANDLVPFLDMHCELSKKEAAALSESMTIHDRAAGQPSEADAPRIAYLDSVVSYVWQCRKVLNTTGLEGLPEAPAPFADTANIPAAPDPGEKPSVMEKIRAAQKEPKPPSKPKPEREKKPQGPEL